MSIPTIRKLLRENPDGMTARELSVEVYGDISRQAAINKSIEAMPDVYRDRWVRSAKNNSWAAVYCLAEIPEDCPYPEREAA